MYIKGIRRMTVIGSMLQKNLDIGEHKFSRFLVLLLYMFMCFNLFIHSETCAEILDYSHIGLYKDGAKVDSFAIDIEPAMLNSQDNGANNLTPLAKQYLESVRKKDDQSRSEAGVFANSLKACEDLVKKISSDNLPLDSQEAALLKARIPKVMTSRDALLEKISQTESEFNANSLPADIVQQHDADIAKFKAKSAELIELLKTYRISVEHKDNAMFNNTISALVGRFNEMESEKQKYQKPLSVSSPMPRTIPLKEAPIIHGGKPMTSKSSSTYYGNERFRDDPVPEEYLRETIEVQLTPEIITLAAELNHSAVEIYQYVRNNFDFEIYYGSRKGALQTLKDRSGNDYDLASLLIALLRASQIYSGYNTVEAAIPYDRLCNWLGIADPVKAMDLLTTAGFNVTGNDSLNEAYLDLVIVEALLPNINYRGGLNDDNVKAWLPLEPSFKQYQYSAAINLLDELPYDFDEEALIADYYSTEREETPLEFFQQEMADLLAQYFPEAEFDDLIRAQTMIEETDDILPGTLPYEIYDYGTSFASIPDNMRYKVTFKVKYYSHTSINYTISIPEIIGKQITVSYIGASQQIQNIIDQAGGIFHVGSDYFQYLSLKPVLKIDGCVVATGDVGEQVGYHDVIKVEFNSPPADEPDPEDHGYSIETYVGDYVGIGINAGSTFPALFDNSQTSCSEPSAGMLLHQTAMSYLNSTYANENDLRRLLHLRSTNDISVAFLFNDIFPYGYSYLEGYLWCGFIISCKGGDDAHVSTDLDCSDYIREYNFISGADGSIGENRVFENNFNAEAVSAIKILELTDPDDICEINDYISDCSGFNHPQQVRELIESYVSPLNDDYKVIIPKQTQRFDHWVGTGMIIIYNETLASRYVCAGYIDPNEGLSANYVTDGGHTITLWPGDDFPDMYCMHTWGPITVDPPAPNDYYWAGSNDILIYSIPQIDLLYMLDEGEGPVCHSLWHLDDLEVLLASPHYMFERWGPGEYTFAVGDISTFGDCEGECNYLTKTVTVFGLSIKTPHGNPFVNPGENGSNDTNERVYNNATPAILTVECEVLPDPNTSELRAWLDDNNDRIRWSVDAISGSTISWNSQWPNDPTKGEGILTTSTFTGTPTQNADFGFKRVKMEFMDQGIPKGEKTANIEVFFDKMANNNPGGTEPNWFYYWSQVHVNSNTTYDAGLPVLGRTPGMTDWNYSTQPDKNDIIIGPGASEEGNLYGVGEFFSGIDFYVAVVIHEEKHVDQIQRADPLVPSSGNDSFRYGWSWNQGTHNHWTEGNDGEWGVAGNDDDNDGITDNAAPTPPFEPGCGDDVNLSRYYPSGYNNWPNSWPLPTPNNGPTPIESEAINASDNAMDNDDNWEYDWGSPGKKHRTIFYND